MIYFSDVGTFFWSILSRHYFSEVIVYSWFHVTRFHLCLQILLYTYGLANFVVPPYLFLFCPDINIFERCSVTCRTYKCTISFLGTVSKGLRWLYRQFFCKTSLVLFFSTWKLVSRIRKLWTLIDCVNKTPLKKSYSVSP